MLKALQTLVVLAFVAFSATLIYLEQTDVEVHYYTVDVGPESGNYLIMLDYALDENSTDDQALAVCETIEGVYYPEYDACAVDALPLYFMDTDALIYIYHEVEHG